MQLQREPRLRMYHEQYDLPGVKMNQAIVLEHEGKKINAKVWHWNDSTRAVEAKANGKKYLCYRQGTTFKVTYVLN